MNQVLTIDGEIYRVCTYDTLDGGRFTFVEDQHYYIGGMHHAPTDDVKMIAHAIIARGQS